MSLERIKSEIQELLADKDTGERVELINELRLSIKEYSPFKSEPVDCVVWIKKEVVTANNYNPNSVANPEMELLKTSILQDGYTQPIVAWKTPENYTVVDGFHRSRVGKESDEVSARIHGYLPLVVINNEREDLGDRMVSTIRHNRARGKHNVDSMSDIVVELKRRNWTDSKIQKNLGMDIDEILRLTQISGLTEMFKDAEFSMSWDLDDAEEESVFDETSGEEND